MGLHAILEVVNHPGVVLCLGNIHKTWTTTVREGLVLRAVDASSMLQDSQDLRAEMSILQADEVQQRARKQRLTVKTNRNLAKRPDVPEFVPSPWTLLGQILLWKTWMNKHVKPSPLA